MHNNCHYVHYVVCRRLRPLAVRRHSQFGWLIDWLIDYIILLTYYVMYVYKRTITRFIADDKVVYQRVREMTRLASDNSWARRRLKHLSWRSQWNYPVHSWKGYASFMSNLPCWSAPFWLVLLTEYEVLHRYVSNARLPLRTGCRTIVPVLPILFSTLPMLPRFQRSTGNSLDSLHAF